MVQSAGKTLIELVSALAIIGILFGFAIPQFSKMKTRSEATSRINWIVGAVNFTRHSAINFRTMVTLCPEDKQQPKISCGRNWNSDLLVFKDGNHDGKFNGNDQVLERISALKSKGNLKWRSFGNRQYLTMTPKGYTNYQNGNFTYCSEDRDPKMSRQIVINVQGRTRLTHYKNTAGHRLDRKGKLLRC